MFRELEFNAKHNKFNNIVLNKLAIGDKSGKGRFTVYDKGQEVYGSFSAVPYPGATIVGHTTVAVRSLDDYAEEKRIKEINLIKIDVEGYEYFVLRGASNVLSKSYNIAIVFEMSDVLLRNFGSQSGDIQEFLRKLHFRIFEIGEGNFLASRTFASQFPRFREI
jgi:FkbM family methyltransferase